MMVWACASWRRSRSLPPRELCHGLRLGQPWGDLGPALLRLKCSPLGCCTLFAPSRQEGGVDALAAQQGADLTGYLAGIGRAQDSLTLSTGELAPTGRGRHLGVGRRDG